VEGGRRQEGGVDILIDDVETQNGKILGQTELETFNPMSEEKGS
jgi:hypothetical protein